MIRTARRAGREPAAARQPPASGTERSSPESVTDRRQSTGGLNRRRQKRAADRRPSTDGLNRRRQKRAADRRQSTGGVDFRRRRRAMDRRRPADAGTAVVEFVLLGVVLLVPLLYLALAASAVQRSVYGVTQAAREAGRAYATGTTETAAARADHAAALAIADQGLPAAGTAVRYGPADGDCADATGDPWPLGPDAVFAVCVTCRLAVPGIPGVLAGERTTVTGRFVVHADPYRDYG